VAVTVWKAPQDKGKTTAPIWSSIPRQPLPDTLCCGRRSFTANDRESPGIARLSPELPDS
jgi:hypothetical protein